MTYWDKLLYKMLLFKLKLKKNLKFFEIDLLEKIEEKRWKELYERIN